MSNEKPKKSEPKPEPAAEKKAAETVQLSAEELKKISGGGKSGIGPLPGSGH